MSTYLRFSRILAALLVLGCGDGGDGTTAGASGGSGNAGSGATAGQGGFAGGGQGGTTSGGASSGGASNTGDIKWSPGHYVAALSLSTPEQAQNARAQWKSALETDARLSGVRAIYMWHDLESAEGVYTPALIDDDIEFLNGLGQGHRLIIEVWSRDFSQATSLPATPQNDDRAAVPDYLLDSGGAALSYNGVTAAVWRPEVMDRVIALQEYLGARYDENPTVEAIHTDEFGPAAANDDPTYSPAATWVEMQRLMQAMSVAWPHTNKFFLGNWPGIGGPNAEGDTETTLAFAESIGFGVGGPDILPNEEIWPGGEETWGELGLQASGGFGPTDFRDRLPISYQNENPYNWHGLTPSMCEKYAFQNLRATHVTWVHATSDIGLGLMPWGATLDALQGAEFRVHSACPENYQSRCAVF